MPSDDPIPGARSEVAERMIEIEVVLTRETPEPNAAAQDLLAALICPLPM